MTAYERKEVNMKPRGVLGIDCCDQSFIEMGSYLARDVRVISEDGRTASLCW